MSLRGKEVRPLIEHDLHENIVRLGNRYKIGKAVDWKKRVASLLLPEPPEIICAIATDDRHKLETDLHDRFEALRLHGEWFGLMPEQAAALKLEFPMNGNGS